jgi:phosphonate transport system substrate-binding protein
MPRYFLGQEGINPDKDFKNTAFSGAHDATVAFVQAGKVDAGVLNASVWDKLVEQKKVDTARCASSPPRRPTSTTTGRCAATSTRRSRPSSQAFLKLDPANPAHKEIMAAAGQQVHPDQGGELQGHRVGGPRGRLLK